MAKGQVATHQSIDLSFMLKKQTLHYDISESLVLLVCGATGTMQTQQ